MSEELEIRIATPDDLDEVMAIAMSAYQEMCAVPPSSQKILEQVWASLHRDRGLCGVIGKPNGKIEGGIILRMGKLWYSDTDVLEERGIFIDPKFRSAKGGRGRKLCEFSKTIADSMNMPLIIGVISNDRTEAKIRLYERQFGKLAGGFFLYKAGTGQHSVMEK
jgi:hypothetical protein